VRNEYKILAGNLKIGFILKDLVVNGRIILIWILKEIGCEGANWIYLA
jgi:hypothetical protein